MALRVDLWIPHQLSSLKARKSETRCYASVPRLELPVGGPALPNELIRVIQTLLSDLVRHGFLGEEKQLGRRMLF